MNTWNICDCAEVRIRNKISERYLRLLSPFTLYLWMSLPDNVLWIAVLKCVECSKSQGGLKTVRCWTSSLTRGPDGPRTLYRRLWLQEGRRFPLSSCCAFGEGPSTMLGSKRETIQHSA
jgi:hypothetical protein